MDGCGKRVQSVQHSTPVTRGVDNTMDDHVSPADAFRSVPKQVLAGHAAGPLVHSFQKQKGPTPVLLSRPPFLRPGLLGLPCSTLFPNHQVTKVQFCHKDQVTKPRKMKVLPLA